MPAPMTDLLSGLANWSQGQYLRVDDVREALRHPTDEQRLAIGKALYEHLHASVVVPPRLAIPWESLDARKQSAYASSACAVLAAAVAGGDQ